MEKTGRMSEVLDDNKQI
jgi:BlaI family transcriptional regulator, penicillinase repressor